MTHDAIDQLIPLTKDLDLYQQSWAVLLESQLETEAEARKLLKRVEYSHSNHRRSDRKRTDELEDVAAAQDDSLSHEVRMFVNELPADLREVIQLVYVDGLTKKQAGAILGISQPTFRRKHDEAIAFLKKIGPTFHF